jgi:hypothetical protein
MALSQSTIICLVLVALTIVAIVVYMLFFYHAYKGLDNGVGVSGIPCGYVGSACSNPTSLTTASIAADKSVGYYYFSGKDKIPCGWAGSLCTVDAGGTKGATAVAATVGQGLPTGWKYGQANLGPLVAGDNHKLKV